MESQAVRRVRVVAIAVVLAALSVPISARQLAPSHSQGPHLGTWIWGAIHLQLAASGGNGSYTWSHVAGTLPPGVSLRQDVPTWFPPSAQAGLIGVATQAGTYTFTLRVTSGGQSTDRQYTWVITGLQLQELPLRDAYVGQSYAHQFAVLNAQGPVTFTPQSLPTGFTLSSSGLLTGTPTSAGSLSVNFSASDGVTTIFQGRGFVVRPIAITNDALPTGTQGVPYTASIQISGGTPPYRFTACPGATLGIGCVAGLQAVPAGLTLHEDGTIDGTPSFETMTNFTVTVTDANNVSYSKMMAIAVLAHPLSLPRFNPYDGAVLQDCTFGSYCAIGASIATPGAGPPYTWTASNLPPGMTVLADDTRPDYLNRYDMEMRGNPSQLGDFNVELSVTDKDGNTVTNTYRLRVTPLYLQDYFPQGTRGVPYQGRLRVIGGQLNPSGPLYNTTVLNDTRFPAGLTFDTSTMTLSGTPEENGQFTYTYHGSFRFADAAGNTLHRRSYFGIAAPDSTVVITTDRNLGNRAPNASTTIPLSACCVPGALVWSHIGGALPPGMTLSAGGAFSGTPTTEGTYNFLLQAADATNPANKAIKSFTLVITSLGMTFSAATALTQYSNVGSSVDVQLSATGGSPPYTWRFGSNNQPAPGLQLDAATGRLFGTFTHSGAYGFNVEAVDAAGSVTSRFFTIAIYPTGVNPPLNLAIGSNFGGRLGTFMLQLSTSGGVPPYSYSLTPGAPEIPGLKVFNGQPLPSFFTATGGYMGVFTEPGTFTTSVRVTDSTGETFDRPLTISVPTVTALTVTVPTAIVGEPYSFQFKGHGGSGQHSWSISEGNTLPPGMSLSASGLLSGIPTSPGTFGLSVRLTDAVSGIVELSFYSLQIFPFGIQTGGVLPLGVVGSPYQVTFSAPGCQGCTWTGFGLPAGLSLSAGGVLTGTPTAVSDASLSITATGSNGLSRRTFALQVQAATPQPLVITTSTVGPTVIGNSVFTRFTAQGGTPPYSWTLEAGELPEGTELTTGDAVGSTPGGALLVGRAVELGVYSFTLRITDAAGRSSTRAFDWNITQLSPQTFGLPLFTGGGTPNPLVYNQPYSQPLLVLGGTTVYTFTAATPLPPGLALSANGVVSGTPTNTGSSSATIDVVDSDGNSNRFILSFNIAGPTATTLNFASGANLGNFSVGFTRSFNVTPNGGTPPYNVSVIGALPPGFALVSGDALLSDSNGSFLVTGRPLATGTQSFTIRAQDSVGNIGVRTFTFAISPVSQVTAATLADGSVGVPYSQPLLSAGGDVTWSVAFGSAMPPGLTLSSAGLISGTPTTAGNYAFTLTRTDATNLALTSTFTMRVSAMRIDTPLQVPDVAVFRQSFNFAFTGTPGVWSATGLPDGLAMHPDGTIAGTPTETGAFSVVVTVTDGVVPLTRRFTLVVKHPNAEVLNIESASKLGDITVGQSSIVTLEVSGGVPPYQWSTVGGTLPPGMQLLLTGANLPNFAPGTTLLTGAPTTEGIYEFELQVRDSLGATTRRSFTLNVSPLFILQGAPRTASAGGAYSQQFTVVGGTPPYSFSHRATSLTQPALPPGFSLAASGLLSGTTTSTGPYIFELTATDAAGKTFTRTLTLQVNGVAGLRITSVNPQDTWVGRGRSTLTLFTNSTSPMDWSLVGGTLPPGLSIVSNAGDAARLGGTPTTPGTYDFTLRATDTTTPGRFADRTFTYRIAPMQIIDPPIEFQSSPGLPAGHVGTPYAHAFGVIGGTAPYTFVPSPFTPLPAGLTLSAAGVLSGTPMATGTYFVQPIVTDAAGHTLNVPGMTLVIAANGVAPPLSDLDENWVVDGSVGVPYVGNFVERIALTRGGVSPFTLAVTDGSALPPGLQILAGNNGFSDRLAGTPTSPGEYEYSIDFTDSTGQSVSVPVSHRISNLSLSPATLRPARVGEAYTQALSFAGGVAPYTLTLDAESDMPPGMSVSAAGVLSGTPTAPGNYTLLLHLADGAASELFVIYFLTVDDASGQSPAVDIAPDPIQVLYQTGGAAPSVPLNVLATSGNQNFTASFSGIPGATLSASSGTTNAALNLTVPTLPVGTYNGVLAVRAPDTANVFAAVPVTVTSIAPPPCVVTLNPEVANIGVGGGELSLGIMTAPGCSWIATLPPGSVLKFKNNIRSGTGPGSLTYIVPVNTGTAPRNFTITVGSQIHAIQQDGPGCSFSTSESKIFAPASGGTALLTITPASTASSCTWTATGAPLTFTPSTGGPLDQQVSLDIPPNPNAGARDIVATVAGRKLTVSQAGAACTVGLSPYNATIAAGGGAGAVQVSLPTGCNYDTTSSANWIAVTSGGSGTASGMLQYYVEGNTVAATRTAALTIGGQTLQITQEALPCSVTLNTSGLGSPFAVAGGAGIVSVTTNGPGCAWAATSNVPWATVTQSALSGNGTVGVQLLANSGSTENRSGDLVIAGQTITIVQSGTTCAYLLQSQNGAAPAAGGSGAVGVIAPSACTWAAASNDPAWLSITSAGTGGNGDVRFTALANPSADPRSGTLTIAGLTYTVTQAGAPCAYLLPSDKINVAAAGASGSFAFSTSSTGCTPTPISYAGWIKVLNTSFNGSGGEVAFSVDPNPTTNTRSNTIRLGEVNFTITQTGGACGYSLNAYGASFGPAGGFSQVLGSPSAIGCTPDVGTDSPPPYGFITLGALEGPDLNIFRLNFSVAPFTSLTPATRFGLVTFGGQIVAVKQKSY